MLPQTRAPWHHYPMSIVTILFYAVGAIDYLLTELRFGFWMDNFSTRQATYFAELPGWLTAIWAVAVWGGLLGAYLMWKRNRLAVLLLFLAFAALTFVTVWLTVVHRPTMFGITGFMGVYILAGTCALSFLIYTYARWERTEYFLN